MMNKDIFDIYNDIDIDLDSYEKQNLTEIEIKKYGKNFSKKLRKNRPNKIRNKLIAVAVSIVLIFGFSKSDMGREIYANILLKLEGFNNYLTERYRNKLVDETYELDEFVETKNIIVENNNIGIKLSEIIADKNYLFASLVLDIEDVIKELDIPASIIDEKGNSILMGNYIIDVFPNIIINDMEIEDENIVISRYKEVDRDKGIYELDLSIYIGDLEIDNECNVEMGIDEVSVNREKITKINGKDNINIQNIIDKSGRWKIDFTTNREKILNLSSDIEINKVLNYGGFNIEIDNLSISLFSKEIIGKIKTNENVYNGTEINYDKYPILQGINSFILEGESDTGEKVVFSVREINIDKSTLRFSYEGGANWIMDNLKASANSNRFFKEAKEIELTPYFRKETIQENQPIHVKGGVDNKEIYDKGEPFRIYLNK